MSMILKLGHVFFIVLKFGGNEHDIEARSCFFYCTEVRGE